MTKFGEFNREIPIPGTVYLVGGAVREHLRDAEVVSDRDWVVVGATEEEMYTAGFRRVGDHFPVFLHPTSKEEYALARTEKKQGRGHKGFAVDSSPDVPIEEDLKRRDLTVNAIAVGEDGTIVDPWNGLADLEAKVLRHVSDAFVEDPLRIYRVARFTAQLPEFEIAPETIAMMSSMNEEHSSLSAERVWAECAKAMRGFTPDRFFETIREVDAVEPWFSDLTLPSIEALIRERGLRAANAIATIGWFHDEAGVTKFCRRLKVPGKTFRLVRDVSRFGQVLCELTQKNSTEVMQVIHQSQALRPGEAFARLVEAVEACASIDLSAVRELVQQLKRIKVVGTTDETYGLELQRARLQFVERNFLKY